MSEDMPRPAGWSDATWAALERLTDDSRVWIKPALHPDLFGITARGIELASYLLDRGVRLSPEPRRHGRLWVPVPLEGRHIEAELVCGELRERVGRFLDEPVVWRALAMSRDSGRRVVERGGRLEITVSESWRKPRRRDPLTLLSRKVEELRAAVAEHGALRGGGYAHLVDRFTQAGIAVPRIPQQLRRRMREVSAWCWTTERDDSGAFGDYLMEGIGRLDGAVRDHVTVSHRGHGLSSYALTWRMAYGPLSMIVQDGWGGAFMEPGRAEGRLAELFGGVSHAVSAAEAWATQEELPHGSWVRPFLLECSPMRSTMRVRVWDPVRGARVDVSLDMEDPWGHLARLIEECPRPDLRLGQIIDASRQPGAPGSPPGAARSAARTDNERGEG